ncbi:DUF1707 SHOCT-like domain-containing protein [Hoyosella subflava]|uniref:DUF1707 domain-containing protein n=1 Tax=Hoyosella subflava (strain DSM 45089 / JCM 17490 / NBRC 109087 / DQS3-9A1) TaxID=443218 RepID=F6EJ57_HOYSD|nr:DUF1707 domain-containing protein [Hoyosella subflava]AEF41289.1 hypothetical protein AS9A_2842 [Hoyosella subflava DQS3-9A1]
MDAVNGPGNERRIGDAERQRGLDLLTRAMSLGYLDVDEYTQRSGDCAVAKFQHEIDALTQDLPSAMPEPSPPVTLPNPKSPWPIPAVLLNMLGGFFLAVMVADSSVGEFFVGLAIAGACVGGAYAIRMKHRSKPQPAVPETGKSGRTWNVAAIVTLGFGLLTTLVMITTPGDSVRDHIGSVLFGLVIVATGIALRGPRRKRAVSTNSQRTPVFPPNASGPRGPGLAAPHGGPARTAPPPPPPAAPPTHRPAPEYMNYPPPPPPYPHRPPTDWSQPPQWPRV